MPDQKGQMVPVLRLAHGEGLALPDYATDGAAGLDLLAAIDPDTPVTLAPGARALVPTGLAMAIPLGFEAQIRPRSGLAAKFGVTVLNAPGTIDADYRGEIKIILINHGEADFSVVRGDRIAQMVFHRVSLMTLKPVTSLDETARGQGGFGSTGQKGKPRS